MAIQMRRGNKADFDPTKMLPGEWAVSIDSDTTKQWVWMCFAPGVVKRMAAFEDIEWVLSDEFAKSAVICDVELDSTATQDYAVGDFLMLHGHLYEVTVAITTGDTIEEDVNVTETKVMDTIAGKVDKETGKGLSTNDYTDAEKAALAQAQSDIVTLNADLANKADDSVVVKSVNGNLPTSGAVEVTAGDIPADGVGDKSVSGNPIVIEDGMASVAKELSVTLEPIQDLHGYESPWIGTDVDKAPYLFRAIADSSVQDKGTHELDKLIGGTLAWNQQLKSLDNNEWMAFNRNAGQTSYADEELTFTFADTPTTDSAFDFSTKSSNFTKKKDHVLFIGQEIYVPKSCNVNLCYFQGAVPISANVGWNKLATIQKATAVRDGELTNNLFGIFNPYGSGYVAGDTYKIRNCMIFDLTQMFGSTIADYIYSLEQATAGAGVAWFRNLFPAPYYAYDAGSLISVKTSAHITRGFNQWDEEWEVGDIDTEGNNVSVNTKIRSKNFIPVIPSTSLYQHVGSAIKMRCFYYDSDKNFISWRDATNEQITTPSNCHFIRFKMFQEYGTTYNNDICINISKTTGTPKNGDYVAYDGHTYPLDSDLELRGIPKLDSNNKLYYDGDVYEASGNVQRKYGIVDLGTLSWSVYNTNKFYTTISNMKIPVETSDRNKGMICERYAPSITLSLSDIDDKAFLKFNQSENFWVKDSSYSDVTTFKTAMSGVYLVYELATPNSETADPFTGTQVIDPDGTEEYVDSRTVPIPVGHESAYANVCPIEGRTGTEVQRTGKNLFDKNSVIERYPSKYAIDSDGSIVTVGSLSSGDVLWENTDGYTGQIAVTFRYKYANTGSVGVRPYLIYSDGTGASMYPANSQTYTDSTAISTAGKTLSRIVVDYGTSGNTTNFYMQVEHGSTATPYEPYSKDTASVSFGQTVYGGQVDFVSGKCRVTKAIVDLGVGGTWYYMNSYRYYRQFPDAKKGSNSINSHYKTEENGGTWMSSGGAAFNITQNYYYLSDERYVEYTDAQIKEVLSGVQMCYELETPIELTLTPAQLSLLQGTNILTADGTINLTYLGSMASNVQSEIDEFENGLNNVIGSIAFIENQTAKTSHAVGEYVILNGIFCKVIAAVSSGETLSFGTNIQATTIGAELRAIWGQLNA